MSAACFVLCRNELKHILISKNKESKSFCFIFHLKLEHIRGKSNLHRPGDDGNDEEEEGSFPCREAAAGGKVPPYPLPWQVPSAITAFCPLERCSLIQQAAGSLSLFARSLLLTPPFLFTSGFALNMPSFCLLLVGMDHVPTLQIDFRFSSPPPPPVLFLEQRMS